MSEITITIKSYQDEQDLIQDLINDLINRLDDFEWTITEKENN